VYFAEIRSRLAGMDVFPAFFPLTGRKVAIAGDGEAAEAKARLFAGSPAELARIAEDRADQPQAYAGALLAFIAVDDDALAERAAAAARQAGALVNATDRPALCDFTTPAVIDRGAVVAAVGTGGAAPLLASILRGEIEARLPEGSGRLAALLGRMQGEVREAFPDVARRRAFLRAALSGPAAQAAIAGDSALAETLLRAAIADTASSPGRVRFVRGLGPADLLTLRAVRALGEADVLIADPDASAQITALARRDARRLEGASVAQMVELALQGLQVVRVTGASGAVETTALEAAGITVEVLESLGP
jgi:precorrin-2 dehydrogenase/sirohydrochlorin ferrochelatase